MAETSVIVCTRNRPDDFRRFVGSLNAQSVMPDEFVVVDASDSSDTKEYVESIARKSVYGITYISAQPGLTRQRNRGIDAAEGKYLFFFDDDIELESGYIEKIVETFSVRHSYNIGGISGRIIDSGASDSWFEYVFRKFFFLNQPGRGSIKSSGFATLRYDSIPGYVDILSGACMAFRREVFDRLRFDENLAGYGYMEDVDFSYRVARAYRLYYQPAARAQHHASTFRTTDTRMLRRMMVRNHRYLFRKNMPQDVLHTYAHYMSILGLFVYNLAVQRDLQASLGVCEGMFAVVDKKENSGSVACE